ncbi:hypothetical protein GCM10009759_42080 [Kitasatospora saccharophila]|uniref:Uncharacterized protein n=1 Tax=Kitasatospora saccharophila TaxID=407973 RepID=A0ABN2X4W7_9ACTN
MHREGDRDDAREGADCAVRGPYHKVGRLRPAADARESFMRPDSSRALPGFSGRTKCGSGVHTASATRSKAPIAGVRARVWCGREMSANCSRTAPPDPANSPVTGIT